MIEKYSDNKDYLILTAEVIEINENDAVIECEELNDCISYEDELCDFHIYAVQFVDL